MPTDTVYGLGVALGAHGGLERLFAAKRRPLDKGIVLLLADHRQAEEVGELDAAAHVLSAAFWPGGLTLVVPQRPGASFPPELTGGARTIGLRLPAHDAPRALAAALGPLPVSSANRSGLDPATDTKEVVAQLGDVDDLAIVLDGGPAAGGVASTVVDCAGRPAADPPSRGDPARRAGDGPRRGRPRPRPSRLTRSLGSRRDRSLWDHERRSPRPCAATAGPRAGHDPAAAVPAAPGPASQRRRPRDPMTATAPTGLAWAPIADVDPELWAAMVDERRRQHEKIELIASENYVFAAVLEAQGSWLTNKYAEGLPGKRYYGGCEFVDVVERLAQERALRLFPGAEHVNVQPHSGAQANMAVYLSTVNPGDRVLGMKLDQGGHLTHGMALNFSGRYFEIHGYGVSPDDERIDYDALEQQAREVRPKLIIGGASAYPRIIDFERMADIAHSVGALLWVDMAHIAGLVAAGLHPSPFPHADLVTTTTHKTLRGARGGLIFGRRELPSSVDPADYPMVKPNLAATIDRSVFPGVQGGPLEHVIAAKAVGFQLALGDEFRAYQRAGPEPTPGLWPRPSARRACGSSRVAPTPTSSSPT